MKSFADENQKNLRLSAFICVHLRSLIRLWQEVCY